MELYLKDTQQVLLAKFTDSVMLADSYKESIKDFYRFKQYTKPIEMGLPLRSMDFTEPYMYAQSILGGTWNQYNTPFMIQIPLCNIRCNFCFVDRDLIMGNGKYFTFEEIWVKYVENTPGNGVIRISGGEPFLASEFLIDFANFVHFKTILTNRKVMLWIDTNLTIDTEIYQNVVTMMNLTGISYGIVGCFKGFDAAHLQDNLSETIQTPESATNLFIKQITNARTLIEYGRDHIFFYVPEFLQMITLDDMKIRIDLFLENLRSMVDTNAPLRTTVLRIKEYATNKDRMSQIHRNVMTGDSKVIWNCLLQTLYKPEELWLPQSQIGFKLDRIEGYK